MARSKQSKRETGEMWQANRRARNYSQIALSYSGPNAAEDVCGKPLRVI